MLRGALVSVTMLVAALVMCGKPPVTSSPAVADREPPCPACPTCECPTCECPPPKPCRQAPIVRVQAGAVLERISVQTVNEGCPENMVCIDWRGQIDLIKRLGACEVKR